MKKIGVLLSGSGVGDGSEIHEAVFTLLALREHNLQAVCIAPNLAQHHVSNHLTDQAMDETRNMLVEAARIARGDIRDIETVAPDEIDGLVIPGGFGAATNLTDWAFKGADASIVPSVASLIVAMVQKKKPIVGLCMGPTVIALALKQVGLKATLSVGTDQEASPYDIAAISKALLAAGQNAAMKTIREIAVDEEMNIISAPCYMMEADILEVRNNIHQAVSELARRL